MDRLYLLVPFSYCPAPVCQPSYSIGQSQVGFGGGDVRADLENDDSFTNYGGPVVIEVSGEINVSPLLTMVDLWL